MKQTIIGVVLQHYAAVMKYISQGPMMLDVHMHKPLRSSRNFMDSLFAFWPGLQVGLWAKLMSHCACRSVLVKAMHHI